MIWTREQAKALTDRALSFSKAESTTLSLTGGERANLRFARNTATTAGASAGYSLAITASFGKKSGTVTTAEFDDAALRRATANAEEIAKLSPDNPEAMPALGPQTYTPTSAYFEDAAGATPAWRATSAGTAIELSKKNEVVTAGFVETQASVQAFANSNGLFAYDRYTAADYNLTARTPDSTGSGWASKSYNELQKLDPAALAQTAIDKAVKSKSPAAIEPGKYTVVLEPAAMADLMAFMLFSADARQADEGRSFFSKKGEGIASANRSSARRSASTRIRRIRSRRRSASTAKVSPSSATAGSRTACSRTCSIRASGRRRWTRRRRRARPI